MKAQFLLAILLLTLSTGSLGDEDSGTAVTDPILPSIPSGYIPAEGSVEGDLWSSLEKAEIQLQRSPLVIRESHLNDYVNRILCRLDAEVCKDIRIYIVRNPAFNALMYPNGMMVIWTGLMMRIENEAQIAAVIGHEMGHYLRQHSLQNWKSIKSTANSGMIISILSAAAGVGLAGELVNIGLMANLFRYQRSHETEADIFGAQRMALAGYDPAAAASLWEYVDKEEQQSIYKDEQPMIFRSHPRNAERHLLLRQLAEDLSEGGHLFASNYWQSLSPYYLDLIDDQIKVNKPGRLKTLLEEHASFEINSSFVDFAWGEFYKSSDEANALDLALEHFRRASDSRDVPAAVWKEIGILEMKRKSFSDATQSLTYYLELQPEAQDSAIVKFYLNSIQGK